MQGQQEVAQEGPPGRELVAGGEMQGQEVAGGRGGVKCTAGIQWRKQLCSRQQQHQTSQPPAPTNSLCSLVYLYHSTLHHSFTTTSKPLHELHPPHSLVVGLSCGQVLEPPLRHQGLELS